jgi:hypothetical protein
LHRRRLIQTAERNCSIGVSSRRQRAGDARREAPLSTAAAISKLRAKGLVAVYDLDTLVQAVGLKAA